MTQPPSIEDLLKRLRATHTLDTQRESRTGQLINPDGPAAWAVICELREELAFKEADLEAAHLAVEFAHDDDRDIITALTAKVEELKEGLLDVDIRVLAAALDVGEPGQGLCKLQDARERLRALLTQLGQPEEKGT